MVNCPNCGAPIDPYKCKCEYCGTWYYDLTGFDFTEGKPCYVKFRTNMNGQEVYITALARPYLETLEMQNDMINVCSSMETKMHSFCESKHCDINMRFECYEDKETKTLFQVEIPLEEVKNGNRNTSNFS